MSKATQYPVFGTAHGLGEAAQNESISRLLYLVAHAPPMPQWFPGQMEGAFPVNGTQEEKDKFIAGFEAERLMRWPIEWATDMLRRVK